MGSKKHKKHHRSEKKEAKESARLEKPGLKLVLKVGGSNLQKPASPPKPVAPLEHHSHHHYHHHHAVVQQRPSTETTGMPPPMTTGALTVPTTTATTAQIKSEPEKGQDVCPASSSSAHEKHKKSKKKKKKKCSERDRKRHKHHHHHHHHHREHTHDRKEKRRREHEHLSGMGDGFPPPAKRPLVESEMLPIGGRDEPGLCNLKRKSSKTPLQTLLSYLLRGLQKKDPQNFFAWPVSDMIAPGYSSIIAHPMDFSSMKQKIENKEYASIHQFKCDLKLMCDNAMTYNRADTIYFKAAKKMWHSGQKLLSRDQVLALSRNIPSILEMTPEELGFDIGEEAQELRSYQSEDVDGDLSHLSHSPDSFSRKSKHKSSFHTSMSDSDDMEADEILSAARKAARAASDRLTLQKPNCRFGFLRQRGDGSTSLAILNPMPGADLGPEDIPVNLETLVGKLSHGGGSIAGFKEDPKNIVRPVKSLNYGSFSSYAPQYDSMFSTLNKEESDLVLSTYGDELGVQYAESLLGFAKDCDYLMSMVDSMLDTLTSGAHSKVIKQINERKTKEENSQRIQAAKMDPSSKDSSMDLSELDIDMEFLNEGEVNMHEGRGGEEEEDADKACLIQRKLDETSDLLQDLAQVQRQRLSAPPPSHLANIQGPGVMELQLAEKVTRRLTDLAIQTTPSAVSSLKGVRKAMGITYETVHCPPPGLRPPTPPPPPPPPQTTLMDDHHHNLMSAAAAASRGHQSHKIEDEPMLLDTLTCTDPHKASQGDHINNCDLTVFLDNPSAVLNL